MRNKPPNVVTILAGGMYNDFAPCSFTTNDGQQLSTHDSELEATAPVLLEDAHPGAAGVALVGVTTAVWFAGGGFST